VLIIDTDPLGGATAGLGIDKNTLEQSIYDVMIGEKHIKDIILETEVGIHLAPSNLDLIGAESYMYEKENRIKILKEALKEIDGYYDYVLIDTPPGASLLSINAICASDQLIVSLDPGIFSLENILELDKTIDDISENVGIKPKLIMAILTRCNKPPIFLRLIKGKDLIKEIEKELAKTFERIFVIPYCLEVIEAQAKGVPISHYRPNSKAALVYKNIAKEVINRGNY
jgi:chromosome partitioning protein